VLKPLVRVQLIIWSAMTASCFIYVAIAFYVQRYRTPEHSPVSPNLFYLFYAAAVLLALAAFAYNRYAMSARAVTARLSAAPASGPPGVLTPRGRRQLTEQYMRLSDAEKRILSLVAYGQTTMIFTLALCEVVVILGLVLVILGSPALEIVPFAAATIILNFVFVPRPVEILRKADALVRRT